MVIVQKKDKSRLIFFKKANKIAGFGYMRCITNIIFVYQSLTMFKEKPVVFLNFYKSCLSHFRQYKRLYLLKKYSILLSVLVVSFVLYVLIFNKFNSYNATQENSFKAFVKSNELEAIKGLVIENLKSPYNEFDYIVKKNDTIEQILKKFDIADEDIKLVVSSIRKKNLSAIFSGTKIKIITKEDDTGVSRIAKILYPMSNTRSVEIIRNKETFLVKDNILKLTIKEVVVSNIIENNLFSAAIEVGIEPNIIVEFARIFGFEIDFQRDIRKGDRFEIYYEKYIDENNITRNTGKIIYASIFVNRKEISLYNFKYQNESGYYDVDGKSIIKSLMKTPINGARLSSSFGLRKHPILGFNKLHQGTDFAAKTGTPIMASGNGVIEMAQKYKGYGNYILIKHNSTYKTAYAHLSKFSKRIRKGNRVSQGEIIGYVGSTGMSTGPHLHYEVIANGKKINSQKLKLPSGKILDSDSRNKFEFERIKIDVKIAQLRGK